MVVIETVLGNSSDPEWTGRLAASEVDVLDIDQWEAQKSRFRKTTAKGVEIAISVDRGTYIRDGDVLRWDAQARSALVARVEVRDVMIVHLDGLRWATSTGRHWSRVTSSMCLSRSTAG